MAEICITNSQLQYVQNMTECYLCEFVGCKKSRGKNLVKITCRFKETDRDEIEMD
jgi:hypothetical protein